jgi:hypothetical protein
VVDDAPEVPTGDIHATVHVYDAVAPLPGRTHYHLSGELGHEEFAQFLWHLSAYHPGKRLLVIHDRGAQHKGAAVEEVVHEASRNFFRYLAGVKNQVRRLCSLKTPGSLFALL